MIERLKKLASFAFCHRGFHAGLAATHAAGMAGLLGHLAEGLLMVALYLALTLRGR